MMHSPKCITRRKNPMMNFNGCDWLEKHNAMPMKHNDLWTMRGAFTHSKGTSRVYSKGKFGQGSLRVSMGPPGWQVEPTRETACVQRGRSMAQTGWGYQVSWFDRTRRHGRREDYGRSGTMFHPFSDNYIHPSKGAAICDLPKERQPLLPPKFTRHPNNAMGENRPLVTYEPVEGLIALSISGHPSSSPVVIVWKVVGQHLFLIIILNNFTAGTKRKVWCD